MDVESRQFLDRRVIQHEAGHICLLEHIIQGGEPLRRHQEGARPAPGLDGAAYVLLTLGEDQPVLGLEPKAELYITEVDVVPEARVIKITQSYDLGHRVSLRP